MDHFTEGWMNDVVNAPLLVLECERLLARKQQFHPPKIQIVERAWQNQMFDRRSSNPKPTRLDLRPIFPSPRNGSPFCEWCAQAS